MMFLRLLFLVILSAISESFASHLPLITACIHNDIWMKCKPVCPKICSDYLYKNRCSPKKCEAGCACPDGWLRKGSDMGYCIPKHKCERWIIN
ncbi:uncharacterized protein [Drosophila bipectinata]|uniref:uncharacterized protein n=1 Tax=Drosophila bipectinata TaxID=42026 RepID=UPI0038B3FAD4